MATLTFQYPDGSAVANGYLLVTLDQDALAPGELSFSAGRSTKVTLDANGTVANPVTVPSSSLIPPTTNYVIRVYSAQGELVRGPYITQT
jgi:hypothetical protein